MRGAYTVTRQNIDAVRTLAPHWHTVVKIFAFLIKYLETFTLTCTYGSIIIFNLPVPVGTSGVMLPLRAKVVW